MGFKISEEDKELINQYTWYQKSTGYWATKAKINSDIGEYKKEMYMHRLIMMPPKEVEIDHINRDVTDNRRENLRYADRSLNCLNIGLQKNNTSGVTGISYCKLKKKWRAQYGKYKKAGFSSKEEAIKWKETITGHGGSCGV